MHYGERPYIQADYGGVGEGANGFHFIFSTVPAFHLYTPMQEEDVKTEDGN